MLNWMFQHDCLDTYCFLSVLYACVSYFYICTCSAQLNMFHMEKRSRNTLIIIIIIIIIIMKISVMIGTVLYVLGSPERHSKLTVGMHIRFRPIPKEDSLRR